MARVRPFTVQRGNVVRPFDALARSIACQQLSGKAAATIFARLRALYAGAAVDINLAQQIKARPLVTRARIPSTDVD